jgi:hypothetical protein
MRINNVPIAPNMFDVSTYRRPLSLETTSAIILVNRVKDWQPLIEVSYVTLLNNCPKCLAVKTLDDLSYTTSGDFQMAKKEYLLLQEVEKAIVTKVGTNIFHDWYGTGLHDLIGSKITDLEFVRAKILEQVSSAVDKVRNVQKQLVASNRKVDPGELFGELLGVDLEETADPTIVSVTVTFTAQSGKNLAFTQLIDLSTTRESVAFT